MALVRLIARPLLSSTFIVGGVNSLRNPDYLAGQAKPVTDRLEPVAERATASVPVDVNAQRLVLFNGAVHVVAGAMLATGKFPRLSSLALAGTLVPTTVGGHRFWEESDPQQRANQQIHFFKNVSMLGGLLLAAVDTEGRPSLAWWARKGAGRVRQRASSIGPH